MSWFNMLRVAKMFISLGERKNKFKINLIYIKKTTKNKKILIIMILINLIKVLIKEILITILLEIEPIL